MRIGGWLRLWIVVAALYGVAVATVAYTTRPTLENLNYRWISEGSDVIAQIISRAENRDIQGYKLFSKLTDAEAIERLKVIAASPGKWEATKASLPMSYDEWKAAKSASENPQLFSAGVGEVNQKYVELIAQFGSQRLEHILLSFAWWLGPSLAILVLGVATGWVIRGFRGKAV